MFAVALRFIVGLAVGGAAVLWWSSRRPAVYAQIAHRLPETASDIRVPRYPAPEWLSDYRRSPNGRIDSSALVDGAVEDTFPASDPPVYSQPVIVGPPAHRRRDRSADERDAPELETAGKGR